MPAPVSFTRSTTSFCLARGADRHGTLRRGVPGRVRQQIRDDLGEPHRVAVNPQSLFRHLDREPMAALLEQVARDLDRLGDGVGDLHGLLAQHDLPPRDLRDVEQIVDETNQVTDLSVDDLSCSRWVAKSARRFMRSSAVTMGERGLRSSWPSMARNSSLARLAASSSASSPSRSFCVRSMLRRAFTCSVISSATAIIP